MIAAEPIAKRYARCLELEAWIHDPDRRNDDARSNWIDMRYSKFAEEAIAMILLGFATAGSVVCSRAICSPRQEFTGL